MSRIGEKEILIPAGVQIEIKDSTLSVTGPKGRLEMKVSQGIKVEIKDGKLLVKRSAEEKLIKALHGLNRALINNMILGVTVGWSKNLEMVGVGYRAQTSGDSLTLNVGFSHPVKLDAPAEITFSVADNTKITVSGIDKTLVGQIAANVRAVRPPEVYKGKGIRYSGEYVRKKAGKAGKALVGGTK